VKTAGGKEGGRGQSAPVDTHASSGASAQANARCPPHQEVLGYIVAATLEHQLSGRRVAMKFGGAADLGGLTPPTLYAPHPLPPVPHALGISVAIEGCCMQGRLELGGARRHPAAGTHARVCMHAPMHAHTRCGRTVGHAPALSYSLAFRASWSLGVRADAPLCVRVCTRLLPGRTLSLTHAVRPCASHSLAGKG